MFIAGVVVGGAVVGVLAHDDHSRYSEYSDIELVTKIEAKEEELNRKTEDLNRIYNDVLSRYREEISILEDEPILADRINSIKRNNMVDNINNINKINKIRNDLLLQIKNKLEKELVDDKKQLAEIDLALVRINAIQLTNKR